MDDDIPAEWLVWLLITGGGCIEIKYLCFSFSSKSRTLISHLHCHRTWQLTLQSS